MQNAVVESYDSFKVRLFLLGLRLFGLVVCLGLTRMHAVSPNLPESLASMTTWITVFVILFHLLAGLIMLKADGVLAALIVGLDFVIGAVLTYFFGEPYFILVFTLPVLEMTYLWGNTYGIFSSILGLVFYIALYTLPLIQQFSEAEDSSMLWDKVHLMGVQVGMTFLLMWLLMVLSAELSLIENFAANIDKEKKMLHEELQNKTAEAGLVYGQVGEREAIIHEMDATLTEMNLELENAYRDLAEAKMRSNDIESRMQEKEKKLYSQLDKERVKLGLEMKNLEQGLYQKERLLRIFRELGECLVLDDLLVKIVFQLQQLIPSQTCVVFMLEDVEGRRELYAEAADTPHTDYFRSLVLQLGEEAPGFVAQSGQSLMILNQAIRVGEQEIRALPGQGDSALIVPIKTEKKTLGVLYLGRKNENGYEEGEFDLLQSFSEFAAMVVSNVIDFRVNVQAKVEDPVTGLYNGSYIRERTREEVRRGRRYTYPSALLYVKVDYFDEILNRAGESYAHYMLKQVALVLQEAVRDTDVIARFEHGFFGLLLVHTDREGGLVIANRIIELAGQKKFGTQAQRVRVQLSIGVAGVPHDGSNAEQLEKRVEGALKKAQDIGGNQACFF